MNKITKAQRSLTQELGRDPSVEEIAENVHMDAGRVREILKLAQETVSLETPVGSEEESHLADFIEDEHTPLLLMKLHSDSSKMISEVSWTN